MASRKPNAAIVLAAGNGRRMGGKYKQFMRIKGRPVMCYSLDAILETGGFSSVVVVVPKEKVSYVKVLLHRHYQDSLIEVIVGGQTRRASIYAALRHLSLQRAFAGGDGYIVIHDAARPLVTGKIVRGVLSAARKWGAAVASVPAIDTLLESEDGLIRHVRNKERMRYSYTPQAFLFRELLDAHEQAAQREDIPATADDLEIILATGAPVKIKAVDSYPNFKLTYPSDIQIIEALL